MGGGKEMRNNNLLLFRSPPRVKTLGFLAHHRENCNTSRNVFIASITDVDCDKESVNELLALLDRTTVDSAVLTAREIDLYQNS